MMAQLRRILDQPGQRIAERAERHCPHQPDATPGEEPVLTFRPPYGAFGPLSDGGGWEGGSTDAAGNYWHHTPWNGWTMYRPNPALTSPTRVRATRRDRLRVTLQRIHRRLAPGDRDA